MYAAWTGFAVVVVADDGGEAGLVAELAAPDPDAGEEEGAAVAALRNALLRCFSIRVCSASLRSISGKEADVMSVMYFDQ